MTLSPSILATLDDLADRHEELSALLGEAEVVSNRDKFTALSREYSELEPIIERYHRISAMLQRRSTTRSAMLDDDDAEMRQLASDDRDAVARPHRRAWNSRSRRCWCRRIRTTTRTSSSRFAPAPAATKRRSSPATCFACTRATPRNKRLASRDPERAPRRTRRLQGDHQPHRGRARLQPAQIRVGRASRATRAADGIARAHPYVRVHRRDTAGGRRSRRHRHPEERPAHRHVSFLRRGRTARQQDRFGGASDAHSDRPRRRVSGRTLAAQEPRPSDVVAESPAARHGAVRSSSRNRRSRDACWSAAAIVPSAFARTTFRRAA